MSTPKEKITPAFLAGGGQMGELIRTFDWSKTTVGCPNTWPQSLRIATRIMLDCPFGMYIAWGKDYIQLYNDGYRPILGSTKHPQALGISTRKTFEEAWSTIEPMFDGVMEGIPVGFPDFILHLDRNGFVEECVFDFSYSPIRLENGEVGGVLVTVIETTEKVKALKALKENEKRFQNLVREANVGIIVLSGEEMRVDVVNEAYGRLIELKPDDLLGKPLFEVIPDAEQVFRPLLNKVRLTGESLYLYDQPYSVVTNGKKVEGYLNIVYQAFKETDGTISGVIALCHDITETINSRKKIEESELKLKQSISDLKLATDSANVGTWSFNIQTQKLEWSALHKRMWGYDEHRNDLNYEDWHYVILPEDKEQALKSVEDARINHSFYEVDYRIKKANNGSICWMKSIGQFYYNEIGDAITLNGITTDITAQKEGEEKIKQSENQFRTFADSIQNLAWIANGDGWIYWYNQRWYDYTGATLEEMQGWGWGKVHHPDHINRIVAYVEEAWKKDQAFELTFPLRRYDGEYRWFLTHVYPIKDANGSIERWIGTNTDITEQKSFTEELEKKVQERTEELVEKNLALELSNAELKSFSYIASHDLKEPLRKIQAFSRHINETEKFSGKTQDYFNRIIIAGERMQNLIDSLLDFSRSNTTELIFKPCDLNTIVAEAKNDLLQSITEKQAVITSEDLPIIQGVYIQIAQLITNLIDNAIKYSRPETNPYIQISSSIVSGKDIDHPLANPRKEYYAIRISDNGIGFEQQYAVKIFELFQRLHQRNEYSGTGIGLSIVKKIVTNHNGFIIAEGKPNIGSTFIIHLPTA